MFLVTSAAYVGQELSSEFGRLPPAFLPVGNRRLYEYHMEVLPEAEERVLTLPESFPVPDHDRASLEGKGIRILPIPDGLSLGESVVCALNLLGHPPDQRVGILHGDTLIRSLPLHLEDVITLSEVDDHYQWAVYDETARRLDDQSPSDLALTATRVANGYFGFADAGLLIRSITGCGGRFIEGINAYAAERPMATVDSDDWLDFGHIHTYYRSRSTLTTQRAFNRMAIGRNTVRKGSADARKIAAEAAWFRELPRPLRSYVPRFMGTFSQDGQEGYEIEYLYLTPLSDLYVFAALPAFIWRRVFEACLEFLHACREFRPDDACGEDLFAAKTRERLAGLQAPVSLDGEWRLNGRPAPPLDRIISETAALIPESPICIIHGDFCFSNVLFDFRKRQVQVVDPRGLDGSGNASLYGPQSYDVAKLAHSVIGLYDFIVAGRYRLGGSGQSIELEIQTPANLAAIQKLFRQQVAGPLGHDEPSLLAMQVQIFLAMLPLHGDDRRRQRALLGNALRLYLELQGT